MHLREDRNPELYLPATSNELLQFSRKLENVSMRYACADGLHTEILVDSSVTQADGSIQLVRLKSKLLNDHCNYTVEWNHATPIHNIERVQVCSVTFSEDKDEDSEFEHGDFTETDRHSDIIEGYLNAERIMNIKEYSGRPAFAEGTIDYQVSLVDDTFNFIETHNGISFEFKKEPNYYNDGSGMEKLYNLGKIALDSGPVEHAQRIITRADLIVATAMLRNRNMISARTIAYKGAPKHIDDKYVGLIECEESDEEID